MRASHIIEQIILEDLKWFVTCGWEKEEGWKYRVEERDDHLTLDEAGNIATTGLVELVSPDVMVRDQDDWKNTYDQYIVEGSELTVRISAIGKKIREILKGSLNRNHITQHGDSLDCRGLSRFEKFWFNKSINTNKVSGKSPATSDLGVIRKYELWINFKDSPMVAGL